MRCAGGLAHIILGRWRWPVLALALAGAIVVNGPARAAIAQNIGATRAALETSGDESMLLLSADFSVPLSRQIEDAINRGISVYFVAEFELKRARWYWFDKTVAASSLTYRLSYHALTQQYRVGVSGYTQRYARLEDALAALSRLRGWPVVERQSLDAGVRYDAPVRLRLDTAQLPRPFQINAITDRDWNPQSEWMRFNYQLVPTTDVPLPERSGSR
jgi:hypothetical protein